MKQAFTILFGMLLSFMAAAQSNITGSVTDESGEPLIGASVLVKGTTVGTITDIDGQFSLAVPAGSDYLEVSFTGFETQEVAIDGRSSVPVVLATSSAALEEIVVVGYGTSSKRNLTDNISKLSAEDIADVPVSNFQSVMAGKAAGVRVTQTNGKVDAGISVRVRGAASVSAGNSPLYVLDGVPLINQNESSNGAPLNPLLSLSPTEIESIDILKDASSAAIYGARAANGVVLITTKRGRAGKAQVSFNLSTGTSEATNLVQWLNAAQYVELFTESAANSGWASEAWLNARFDRYSNNTDWRNGAIDTDWNDVAFRTGSLTNGDFSVSGGDSKTTYYLGGSYSTNKGILLGNNLDRGSARVNLQHKYNDKLTLGLNLGYSNTGIDRIANDNAFTTPLQAIAQAPISPPRLEDGTPFPRTVYANFLLEEDYANLETKLRRTTGKAYAQYQIIPQLKFNTDFGYDMSNTAVNQFRGSLAPFQSTNGEAFASNTTQESFVWSNYLTFVTEFSDKNEVNLVVGTEFNEASRNRTSVTGQQFPSDDFQTVNSAAEISAGEGFTSKYNFLSYFARAQYIYDNKYFVKGSIRRDGSSRFGSNNRFGTFPAASVGWIVSNEDFFDKSKALSFLKVRASYGELGNSEIGNFPSRFLFQGVSYNQRPGLAPTQPGNSNLTWETSKQMDLGLEFGLFNDRLTGELDYYTKNTDGLLFQVPLPGTSGSANINRNIGVLKSNGIELLLNSTNIDTRDFTWTTSFNIASNNNELSSLPNSNADIITGQNVNRVGESVSSFYLPEYAGVDPANGDALYYINGESGSRETTNNIGEANRIVAGRPFPNWTGGITNDFSYGNLSLSFTFMGEFGASIYNGGGRFQSANADWFDNQTVDQMTRWQNPGDITMVPQARLGLSNGSGHSTRFLEKADFIRLKNLTLGYTLPNSITDKAGMSSARIYVTGVNLLTFTDYSGYDPESRSDAGGVGQAFYSAPAAKTISFGVNVNF